MPSDAIRDFKERIKRRRSLYRSLARRGIIKDDPTLNSVDGSLYDRMAALSMNMDITSPIELANKGMRWFKACSVLYSDPELTPPQGWNSFLSVLKTMGDDPETVGYGRITDAIQSALGDYAIELMAIDEN